MSRHEGLQEVRNTDQKCPLCNGRIRAAYYAFDDGTFTKYFCVNDECGYERRVDHFDPYANEHYAHWE